MNRNQLENTLTESVYYEWFNGRITLYVGSWFIETDNQGYMFPWADKKSTIEELKTYIND